jgi:hypothetical protein
MSNKTPFEVRLELLAMAKDMLVHDFEVKKDAMFHKWHLECEKAVESQSAIPSIPPLPEFPSTKQILEKANELNAFVSKG